MRVLISGGPGSGCTTTAAAVGAALDLPVFDSDSFFHKPTDPPYQEQYSPEERRDLLTHALAGREAWIVSGSVATWEMRDLASTHGIFLETPCGERLARLEQRQRARFGPRIDPGGDMEEEHLSFMKWASAYEERTGVGRNATADRAFLEAACGHFTAITGTAPFQQVVAAVVGFLTAARHDGGCGRG